jgi:hypothetical protein
MKQFFLFILLLSFFIKVDILPQTSSKKLIAKMDSSLIILVKVQTKVKDVYPCLEKFQPVAVPYKDSLIIFDYDSSENSYKLIKETTQPFPLHEGIQASFPLSVYDNKPTCIVNPKTFNSAVGYTTIMHEFIHCCQYNSVEPELKSNLEIYKTAMKNKNYSWEIAHPFDWDDSVLVNLYDTYKQALETNDIKSTKEYRFRIKRHLSGIDFEYLLWEEWKEGLARYVENKVHDRLNIERNNYGKDKPYNRASFYYSGELLITKLAEINPELPTDMKSLFEKMRDF